MHTQLTNTPHLHVDNENNINSATWTAEPLKPLFDAQTIDWSSLSSFISRIPASVQQHLFICG